jgi:hypothetical protein
MGVGGGDEELGGRAKVAPAGWLGGGEGDICEDWRGVSGDWRMTCSVKLLSSP